MNSNKLFLVIVSLVITFLFLIVVLGKMSRSSSVYKDFMPLLIPAIFILPGAVEVRFFIMVYMLLIYTLVFNTEWKKLFSCLRPDWGRMAILFTLYSGIICSIWSTLLVSEVSYKIFMY